MQLVMLGTGSLTSVRNCSSAVIDETILVDCGSGIVKQMLRNNINLKELKAVLISHLHADHFFDLPYFLLIRNFTGCPTPCKIYGPKDLKQTTLTLCQLGYPDITDWENVLQRANVEFVTYDQKDIAFDNYKIKVKTVDHGAMKDCYGFEVSDGIKSVAFSGDSALCAAIEEMAEESDLSVLDCSFVNDTAAHMGCSALCLLAERFQKPIIATHMAEGSEIELKKLNRKYIILPQDGNKYEI